MTPKTITVLILRLFAIYVLFQIVSSIGVIISSSLKEEFRSFDLIEYQVFQISIYIITVIILYAYSEKIADKITKVLPVEKVNTNWTSVELLTILIIAISIYSIIEAIPWVVNQLNTVLTSFRSELGESAQMKQRFNMFFFGLLGALLKIIVAVILIWKSKSLAIYLDKIQKKQAA
jgi:hypothetical protein